MLKQTNSHSETADKHSAYSTYSDSNSPTPLTVVLSSSMIPPLILFLSLSNSNYMTVVLLGAFSTRKLNQTKTLILPERSRRDSF